MPVQRDSKFVELFPSYGYETKVLDAPEFLKLFEKSLYWRKYSSFSLLQNIYICTLILSKLIFQRLVFTMLHYVPQIDWIFEEFIKSCFESHSLPRNQHPIIEYMNSLLNQSKISSKLSLKIVIVTKSDSTFYVRENDLAKNSHTMVEDINFLLYGNYIFKSFLCG